jgi:hypothetical protein
MRPLTWQAMAEYLASAVDIPSPTTDKLCAAAKAASIDVVIVCVARGAEMLHRIWLALVSKADRVDVLPGRCPLWVISGHMQCKRARPLCPQ